MRKFLDSFILNIPRLFLKQYAYAWFPLIVLWSWPPNFSIIFLAIIIINLFLLWWRIAAWVSHTRREYAGADGKFYLDRPAVPWKRAVTGIAILLVVSGVLGSLLDGQLGLSAWHFFFIIFTFTITYQDYRFFGYTPIYIITATGIAVYFAAGHLDYRLFFTFKEIARIDRVKSKMGTNWTRFTRLYDEGGEGFLLVPKDINGFSKRIKQVFIAPQDMDGFFAQLPFGFGKIGE